MRPPFPAFLATALGCVALLVVSCSSTEAPREPGEAALSFDVQDVIRDVTAQAGPTIFPEFSADSPVYSSSGVVFQGQKAAYGGGFYLVVWSIAFPYDPSSFPGEPSRTRYQVMATRVRAQDGAVLDPGGLVLASNLIEAPHLAVAADGTHFLVAWDASTDTTHTDSSIFARRVNGATGAMLEPMPFRVSPSGQASMTPDLAFDGSHYLVVWAQSSSGDNSDIRGTRVRAADGVVLEPDGLLVCAAPGRQTHPAIAFSQGQFLVVWQDDGTGTHSALHGTRVRASDGMALDPSGIPLSTESSSEKRLPAVAAIEGTFLVSWLSLDTRTLEGVRVAGSDGRPTGLPFTLKRLGWQDTQLYALSSAGTHFQVLWSEYVGVSNRDLVGVKIPVVSGAPFDSKRLLGFDTNDDVSLALALGPQQLLTVWSGSQARPQLLALRMEPSSRVALDAEPLRCSTEVNAQWTPVVAAGSSNTLVVWQDSRNWQSSGSLGDSRDIYGVRVRHSDGVVLDSTPIPIARAAGAQDNPVVSFDGTHYFVVWLDARVTGSPSGIRGARIRASDGVVLDPMGIVISSASGSRLRPALAFGGGTYLVTWVGEQPTRIQGARIRAADGALLDREPFTLSSVNGNQSSYPMHSVAFAQDVFLVVWHGYRSGSNNLDIHGARVQRQDGSVLDPVALALNTMPGDQRNPSVASSGTEFLVAWLDSRSSHPLGAAEIYGTRVRPSTGENLDGTGLALNTEPGVRSPLSLTFQGRAYALAWSSLWPGTPSIKLMHVNRQGTPLDGTGLMITDLSKDFAQTPWAEVAALGTRHLLVAYARFEAEFRQARIKLRRLETLQANGASCTSPPQCESGVCTESGVCCNRTCTWGRCGGGTCVEPALRLTCPAEPTVEATSASGTPVAYQVQVQGPGPFSMTYSQESGTPFPLGTTPVTVSATDRLGNSQSCAFKVHVRDTTAPSLACPSSMTLKTASPSGTMVNYPPATASDGVSPVTLGYSQGSGTRFAVGTTPVTVTATDASGNTSTCGFEITVKLAAPPQVTCPADVRAEATSASGSVVYYAPATAQGTAPLALSYSRASGTRIGLGTTPITATVTDGVGQTASCVFQVHVRDTTEPSLSCPAPVTAEATSPSGASVSYPPATASDRVSPVTLGYSQESGTHFAVGTTPVTVTATDTSGNASTCGFTVTVRPPASSSATTW